MHQRPNTHRARVRSGAHRRARSSKEPHGDGQRDVRKRRRWSSGDPAWLRDYVVASARPGDIVLLHFNRIATVKALPGIIDGLRARGFAIEGLETVPSSQ